MTDSRFLQAGVGGPSRKVGCQRPRAVMKPWCRLIHRGDVSQTVSGLRLRGSNRALKADDWFLNRARWRALNDLGRFDVELVVVVVAVGRLFPGLGFSLVVDALVQLDKLDGIRLILDHNQGEQENELLCQIGHCLSHL